MRHLGQEIGVTPKGSRLSTGTPSISLWQVLSQVQWFPRGKPAFGRLRQEHYVFEVSLVYIASIRSDKALYKKHANPTTNKSSSCKAKTWDYELPWVNLGQDVIWNNSQGRKEFTGHSVCLEPETRSCVRIECSGVQAASFLNRIKQTQTRT